MLYIKAIHIIFVVTWFCGLFYIVRLFVYNAESNEKSEPEKTILKHQFSLMIKRLWFGITWPSAILTLILGPLTMFIEHWNIVLFNTSGRWLLIKLIFVAGLYGYHFSLHQIYKQQSNGIFKYTSQQLRVWNEVATIFLVVIVMLAVVKQTMSFIWATLGLIGFIFILLSAIRIYKMVRNNGQKKSIKNEKI